MTTLKIRIDNELNRRASGARDSPGVSMSEAVRLTPEYIAQNNRLPVNPVLLADDDDAELIEIAPQRLANPDKRTRVNQADIVDV